MKLAIVIILIVLTSCNDHSHYASRASSDWGCTMNNDTFDVDVFDFSKGEDETFSTTAIVHDCIVVALKYNNRFMDTSEMSKEDISDMQALIKLNTGEKLAVKIPPEPEDPPEQQ